MTTPKDCWQHHSQTLYCTECGYVSDQVKTLAYGSVPQRRPFLRWLLSPWS